MTTLYFKTYYRFSIILEINIKVFSMSRKIYGELSVSLPTQNYPT